MPGLDRLTYQPDQFLHNIIGIRGTHKTMYSLKHLTFIKCLFWTVLF